VRVAIVPRMVELRVMVNPTGEVTWEPPSAISPWMYAPWRDAQRKGVIEMEVEGETLRALLTQVSDRYKQVNVDFDPIDPRTNDVDFDYDVLINGKNYEVVPYGLGVKLTDGDEVQIKMVWRWDG